MKNDDDNEKSSSLDSEPDVPAEEPEDQILDEAGHPVLDLGDSSEEPEPEKKKKFALGTILFLLILLGGGFLGYPYILEFLNPPPPAQPLTLKPRAGVPEQIPAPSVESTQPAEPAKDESPSFEEESVRPPEKERLSGAETPTIALHISGITSSTTEEEAGFANATKETEEAEEVEEESPQASLSFELEVTSEPEESAVPEEPVEKEIPIKRSKEVQAYLDFIDSSAQQLADWIKEGYDKTRGYLSNLLS